MKKFNISKRQVVSALLGIAIFGLGQIQGRLDAEEQENEIRKIAREEVVKTIMGKQMSNDTVW